MFIEEMTKEEKELVAAIVNLHFAKGWCKPNEFDIYCTYGISDRDSLEELIDNLWNELNA